MVIITKLYTNAITFHVQKVSEEQKWKSWPCFTFVLMLMCWLIFCAVGLRLCSPRSAVRFCWCRASGDWFCTMWPPSVTTLIIVWTDMDVDREPRELISLLLLEWSSEINRQTQNQNINWWFVIDCPSIFFWLTYVGFDLPSSRWTANQKDMITCNYDSDLLKFNPKISH